MSNNAHAYLGAPYGIYKTRNGYLALAMGSIPDLGEILGCSALEQYKTIQSWYDQRDEIKTVLADHLLLDTTEHWLQLLEPADFWCANVLNWKQLMDTEAFQILEMLQKVSMSDGYTYDTTRCPITINEAYLLSALGAPFLGEHNEKIADEFEL